MYLKVSTTQHKVETAFSTSWFSMDLQIVYSHRIYVPLPTHAHSHRHSITMPASYRSLILGHSSLPSTPSIPEDLSRSSSIVPQLQGPVELVKMELPNLQDKMIDRGMSVFLSVHPSVSICQSFTYSALPSLTCSSLPPFPHFPHILLPSPHIAEFIEEVIELLSELMEVGFLVR